MVLKMGCGTKQPILKRDKTADFQNETKQPIFKTGQNSRFSKRNKMSAVQPIYMELDLFEEISSFVVWLGRFAPFAK